MCVVCVEVGEILAQELIDGNFIGRRPTTLVGFSLGARVIFYCLKVSLLIFFTFEPVLLLLLLLFLLITTALDGASNVNTMGTCWPLTEIYFFILTLDINSCSSSSSSSSPHPSLEQMDANVINISCCNTPYSPQFTLVIPIVIHLKMCILLRYSNSSSKEKMIYDN